MIPSRAPRGITCIIPGVFLFVQGPLGSGARAACFSPRITNSFWIRVGRYCLLPRKSLLQAIPIFSFRTRGSWSVSRDEFCPVPNMEWLSFLWAPNCPVAVHQPSVTSLHTWARVSGARRVLHYPRVWGQLYLWGGDLKLSIPCGSLDLINAEWPFRL